MYGTDCTRLSEWDQVYEAKCTRPRVQEQEFHCAGPSVWDQMNGTKCMGPSVRNKSIGIRFLKDKTRA
jgi:hypothetical protein